MGNYFLPMENVASCLTLSCHTTAARFHSQAVVCLWRTLLCTAGSLSISSEANNYDRLKMVIAPGLHEVQALNPNPGPSPVRLNLYSMWIYQFKKSTGQHDIKSTALSRIRGLIA